MKKSITMFIITVIIVMNSVVIPVCAEVAPTVAVGSVSGLSGESVEIPVVLSENSGFSNIGIEISYDDTVLTLTGVKSVSAVNAIFTTASDYSVIPYNMSWDCAGNSTFNGTLAILTFEINDCKSGTYPISVDYYKGRNKDYIDGNNVNYDEDFEPLGLQYSDGFVTVKKTSSGGSDGSMSVSGISFSVTLDGDTCEGTIYAALYDDEDSLKATKIYPASDKVNIEFDAGMTGTFVKIMWWNDNLIPMCTAQTVSLK